MAEGGRLAPRAQPVLSLRVEDMRFGGVPVLGALTLELSPGECVALTGPSGVGKTTLLRIVAGLETRFRGTRKAPRRIAMVFQEPTLLPWARARDNITLTTSVPRDRAETALAEVGLSGRGDAFPGQLSLGQQRRLALARAFAADPALLLLDEPFVSLDPERADEMMTLFETLRAARDVTTLIVTHVEAEARRLSHRILRLAGQPAHLSEL